MRSTLKPAIAWLAVGSYGFGVYLLMTMQKTPESLPAPSIPHFDKLPHAVLFGFLAWMLAWAASTIRPAWGRSWPLLILWFSLVSGFGVACEFVQATLPGRSYEVADMIANAVGAALAVWLFRKRNLWQARQQESS